MRPFSPAKSLPYPSQDRPRSFFLQTHEISPPLFSISHFIDMDSREERPSTRCGAVMVEGSLAKNGLLHVMNLKLLYEEFCCLPAQSPQDLVGDNQTLILSKKPNTILGAFLYNHPHYYPKQPLPFDPITNLPIVTIESRLSRHPLPYPKLVPVPRIVWEQHHNAFLPTTFKVIQKSPGIEPELFHPDNLAIIPYGFAPGSKQVAKIVDQYLSTLPSAPSRSTPEKEDF